jgi:hypothetical protein
MVFVTFSFNGIQIPQTMLPLTRSFHGKKANAWILKIIVQDKE